MKQIMSGLSVATCKERSERFERRPRIFEVHTVNEEGGDEALGAGEGMDLAPVIIPLAMQVS